MRALALLVMLTAVARADDAATWPTEVVARPLALAPGMFELRGDTVGLSLSSGAVGKPVSLAPSGWFGVADNMTVGVTHSSFEGPEGLCVTGASNGCAHVYNNVNLEALHSVVRGAVDIATHPTLAFVGLSPDVLVGFRIATTIRYRAGTVAVVADPGVLIGFNHRGSGNATEFASLPLVLELQATAQLEAHVTTGLAGSLSAFGDTYAIPAGAGATFAASHVFDVGADVVLLNALGHDGSGDARFAILRVAFRH